MVDDEAFARPHQRQLTGLGPSAVRAERGCTVEQIGEALKAGRHVVRRLTAARQLHVKDEARRAKLDARAFADEETVGGVAAFLSGISSRRVTIA